MDPHVRGKRKRKRAQRKRGQRKGDNSTGV
jgi:hypothetical protein